MPLPFKIVIWKYDPTLKHRVPAGTSLWWSIRNQASQQEVSSGRVREASAVFTSVPRCSLISPRWELSSCRETSSGLPLLLHDGELHNYFIIHYNVIITEIR